MSPASALPRVIIKKRTKPFGRFMSDRLKRLNPHWHKPRGIDSPMRHQYRGQRPMVKVGYRSDKRTRYVLPCGFYKVRVNNIRDLEALTSQNNIFAAEIARRVSWKNRLAILDRAKELDIKVINKYARTNTAERE